MPGTKNEPLPRRQLGLTALGDVIEALSKVGPKLGRRATHHDFHRCQGSKNIPYRNHKLTMLMQDGAWGNLQFVQVVQWHARSCQVVEKQMSNCLGMCKTFGHDYWFLREFSSRKFHEIPGQFGRICKDADVRELFSSKLQLWGLCFEKWRPQFGVTDQNNPKQIVRLNGNWSLT